MMESGDRRAVSEKKEQGSFALPGGWVWTRLGETLAFVKGKKPKTLGLRSDSLTVSYINIDTFENKVFTEFTDAAGCPLCQPDDTLVV